MLYGQVQAALYGGGDALHMLASSHCALKVANIYKGQHTSRVVSRLPSVMRQAISMIVS